MIPLTHILHHPETPSPPPTPLHFSISAFQNFSFYPMSSVLIRQGLPQPERLATLNDIAITQMRVMLAANNVKSLKLNPADARKILA